MPSRQRPQHARFVLVCQQALAVAVVVVFAAPAASIVELQIVAPSSTARPPTHDVRQDTGGALVASAPVKPTIRTVPIGVSGRGSNRGSASGLRLAAADITGPGTAAITPPEPVAGLATVGVTWSRDVHVPESGIDIWVRTRTGRTWTGWSRIPYHDDHGPDPGSAEARRAVPGSDPMYVGAVDDVQVRVGTPTGVAPAGLRLELVNPGREHAPTREAPAIDTGRLLSATTGTPPKHGVNLMASGTTPATSAYVTPKPKIFSRAQWGADEKMREKSSLHYGTVSAGFVHHTVNANNYTRAQVPAIIRGIYAFHTRVRGWSDIGYNFLVDRFGRIWEGRYGGVDRPVVGAHTLNYNQYSFAMAAIGNFDIYDKGRGLPPPVMLRAYGRLFAWKLSLHGVNAASKHQWVGHRWLAAIDGHRDVGHTACPGRYLYAKLPRIRVLAAADQHPFATRMLTGNLSGKRWPDLVVRDATTKKVYVVRTGGQVAFAAPKPAAVGFRGMDLVAAGVDLTGDGVPDLVARNRSTKRAAVYPGDGAGHFGAPVDRTSRFAGLDQLTAVGDWNGDGNNDLVGRAATTHALYLYPGNGKGGFGARVLISADWSGYDTTAGVGDLDGDGHPDLVARSAGRLWLIPGTGASGVKAAIALPGAWGGYNRISGIGDLTNDGRPDVLVRSARTGLAYLYPGTGNDQLGHRLGPFPGFGSYSFLSGAGRATGSKHTDIVGVGGRGEVRLFANRGRTNLGAVVDSGLVLPSATALLNVGDWDGDGYGDLIARIGDNLYLYRGDGSGHFGTAIKIGGSGGWNAVSKLAAVGDVTADGRPDLMGQPAGGSMRIYPGRGAAPIAPSYIAHTAISGNAQVGVGLWNRDGAPDTLVRRSDGTLVVYAGNGPGGLMGSTRVGTGAGRYNWLIGVGDVDGDGRADVIARGASGALWLLPGNAARNGFGARRYLGGGFSGYDLS
ncbi:MAG: FG-GAP-like repeat-containing protein [Nocardioidaceae bacterium]